MLMVDKSVKIIRLKDTFVKRITQKIAISFLKVILIKCS